MWATTGSYMPTVPEVLIVVGVISVGALAFMVLSNKLLGGEAASEASADPARSEAPQVA